MCPQKAVKLDKQLKPSDNVLYANEGWQTTVILPSDGFSVPLDFSDLDGLVLLTVQGKSIRGQSHL